MKAGRQVTVYIPEELLERIDLASSRLKCGRSAFMRDACIFTLAELGKIQYSRRRGPSGIDSGPDEAARTGGRR